MYKVCSAAPEVGACEWCLEGQVRKHSINISFCCESLLTLTFAPLAVKAVSFRGLQSASEREDSCPGMVNVEWNLEEQVGSYQKD